MQPSTTALSPRALTRHFGRTAACAATWAEELLCPAHPTAQHDQMRVRDPEDRPDRLRDRSALAATTPAARSAP
jgi:hypothetical protein